jgi:hypothetical protein
MQGDTLHAGQGLIEAERVRDLVRVTTRLQAMRDQAVSDLEARTREVEALSSKIDVLSKVAELFRALMDRLVLDHVRSVESIVSEGLHTIFYDQELNFEAEITQRYNKIAIDFFITQEAGKVPVRGHPLESFGGGPASIASLILRLLAMLRLKRWPVLLLDETLAAVSEGYVDQTGRFLQKLSESTGIPLLLVTHTQAFLEHASVAYSGSEVGDGVERHLQLHRRGAS